MVALRQTLNPQDELKIVLDRRRNRPAAETPTRPDGPAVDRRRHQHLDLALEVDGFAIVPETVSVAISAAQPRRPAHPFEPPEAKRDDPPAPRDEPVSGGVPDEAHVSNATPLASDQPSRVPSRRIPNPSMQRLFREESRDEPSDDVDHAGPGSSADVERQRRPRFSELRISNPHMARSRVSLSRHRDAQLDDEPDEPRRVGSRTIWLVTAVVAVLSVLAILLIGQTIDAFKIRLDPRRPSVANRILEDRPPAVEPLPPPNTPPDSASAPATDKTGPLIPSAAAEPTRNAGAEPARARNAAPAPTEASRTSVPTAQLPPRRTPQPTLDASAQPRRQAEPPATTQSSTSAERSSTRAPTFPGLPRVALIRSPASTSSGTGGTYVVRISDTQGRPLVGAEASLVDHMGDGVAEAIPLDPGPEPGTYRAILPQGRALRDLRVRIMTSNTRFDVPVEP
jgi:hypothetical protein